MVFDRLLKADLRLKPSKCFLFRTSVEFLGHIVTREGVRTDPGKIEKVGNWPTPEAVGEMRGFLGFCGYDRRFAQDFATIARPLYSLTKTGQVFLWTPDCETAFLNLKTVLTTAPGLAYPRFGQDASPFLVDVDASGLGLGAVLSQVQEGLQRPRA